MGDGAPSTTNATWVEREFDCETDRFDYPWHHIQDASFNVVGLTNQSGTVVRQYTLDPYGRVIRSEQFLAHAPSRIGRR